MAYETTEVAVEKSQGEIRKLLYAHHAANFAFAESVVDGQPFAAVDFVHDEQHVRIRVPVKLPTNKAIVDKLSRQRSNKTRDQVAWELTEQEAKRIWRVMFHTLKARLVAVEEGVESFEEAFLSHLVDPVTGMTMWDAIKGPVEAGALKAGGPGLMSAPLRELVAAGDIVEAEVVE